MDGRGPYIWGSFGAFLLCIVVEIVLVRLRIGRAQERIQLTVAADAALSSVDARRVRP
jgi:heme exporter protein CcmD